MLARRRGLRNGREQKPAIFHERAEAGFEGRDIGRLAWRGAQEIEERGMDCTLSMVSYSLQKDDNWSSDSRQETYSASRFIVFEGMSRLRVCPDKESTYSRIVPLSISDDLQLIGNRYCALSDSGLHRGVILST